MIKTYNDITVELIRKTENPIELITLLMNITMKKNFKKISHSEMTNQIKFLLNANHTSLFEHINYTFVITGASRNFLTQITRHRHASYTSGSQHYQTYNEYNLVVDESLVNNKEVEENFKNTIKLYSKLIDNNVPKWEARQILPGGMENNLIITINARSLINLFNLRLCHRNVEEMQIVTTKMYEHCINHFPELFKLVGPDCYMEAKCKKCHQGKMSCGVKWEYPFK